MLLHMCTVNQDHMMYGSWDIKYKGHGFLSFWASFCPLTLLTTQKIKNFEKIKKPPGDIILHLCTTKDNHMMYSSWDIKCNRQNTQQYPVGYRYWVGYIHLSPRYWNTGLASSKASLTSWGEGASLALVGHPSSDGVMIKMPYGVDVLHQPASHPIFSYWVG